jgi:hypothetical protein
MFLLRIAYLRGQPGNGLSKTPPFGPVSRRNAVWISRPQPLFDTAIAVVYFSISDGAPEAWS